MNFLQQQILNISKSNYHPLIKLPNLRGVGFGFKYVNNRCTYEPCVHVFVSKKINKINISYEKLVPKYFMGVKTDVTESGVIKAHYLTDRVRPLKGGCQVLARGKDEDVIGTMACIVSKGSLFKNYYILGNNHILANENKFPKGTPIIQPPHHPTPEPGDLVAKLSSFVKLKFEEPHTFPENTVDCAIAKIISKENITNKVAFLGEIEGVGAPRIHLKVRKIGASTGLTEGKILTIGTTIVCDFENNKRVLFVDQITTSRMSSDGDSGSLLIDSNNRAIGLLVGGEDGRVSFFNDISLVLKELKVNLLPSSV